MHAARFRFIVVNFAMQSAKKRRRRSYHRKINKDEHIKSSCIKIANRTFGGHPP